MTQKQTRNTTNEPLPEQTDNGLHEGDEFLTDEELNELIKAVSDND